MRPAASPVVASSSSSCAPGVSGSVVSAHASDGSPNAPSTAVSGCHAPPSTLYRASWGTRMLRSRRKYTPPLMRPRLRGCSTTVPRRLTAPSAAVVSSRVVSAGRVSTTSGRVSASLSRRPVWPRVHRQRSPSRNAASVPLDPSMMQG